jgi:hypothetical protein
MGYHREMDEFAELIGRKILGVLTDQAHGYLVFNTDIGPASYMAEGDCCSYSWFENISGLEYLLDATVIEVRERKMPGAVEKKDSDDYVEKCTQFYGWTLVTNKGHFDIEMRNESNGYYGGYVSRVPDPPKDVSPVLEDF